MSQARLVRAPNARVLVGPGVVWLLGDGAGDACVLEGDSGELVLAVLAKSRTPSRREEIVAAVAEEADVPLSAHKPIDDAVALLVRMGALVDEAPASGAAALHVGNVIVSVTGAIGAVHTPRLVQHLLARGHDVRVAMTRAARRFTTARAFEALTHHPVTTTLWRGSPSEPAPHIELAQWADLMIVCPCTASTLARLAAGDCSEVVSAVATTTRAPVLVVPSMNTEMFHAPLVVRNLEVLREHGFFLAEPSYAREVADAPRDRVMRLGGAAPAETVLRYVDLLFAQVASNGPRLASRAEWDADHGRRELEGTVDADLVAALAAAAPAPARVLEVGTGLGEIAREAARTGHTVVATDFSETAIERAHGVAPELPVTWLVDDAVRTRVRGSFDVCIDRACLGCIPMACRERYVAAISGLVRSGGMWLVKVHQGPMTTLRAYGFTVPEITELVGKWFDVTASRETTLSFGAARDRPAWMFELRRR